jgi:hypothetical protein
MKLVNGRGARSRILSLTAIGTALSLGILPGALSASARAATSSNPIPVTVNAQGWIVYGNLLATSLNLVAPKTTTIAGTFDSSGTCTFNESGTVAAGSMGAYEEQIAYDPTTCQEQVISGGLTAASQSVLNGVTPSANPDTPAKFGSAAASPLATQYQQAYSKGADIDPIFFTITSFTSNLKWPLNGAAKGSETGRYNPYEFKWDGWRNTGTPPLNFYRTTNPNGYALQGAETFYNNDFEALLVAELGPVAIIDCLGIGTATYHQDETVYGRDNGATAYSTGHSKSGGCTNLTHFSHSANFGWNS